MAIVLNRSGTCAPFARLYLKKVQDVTNVAKNNQRWIRGKLNKYLGISGAYIPLCCAVRMCWKGVNERTTQTAWTMSKL
jgi:hypothetical protein